MKYNMVMPLLELDPERKLNEMIERLSMTEPFQRYILFRTDREWNEEIINYFTTETDQFLCVYHIGYDPAPVLKLAQEKGFTIGSDYILDSGTLYTTLSTIGVIYRREGLSDDDCGGKRK